MEFMPYLQSIASRIFGLAVFLLVLTLALAGFLMWQVAQLENEIHIVAASDLPLLTNIGRMHEAGLRRRLAFERWYGALNAKEPDQTVIAEAEGNYKKFSGILEDSFSTAQTLIAQHPGHEHSRKQLPGITELLQQVHNAYPLISTRQMEAVDLQRNGNHDRAEVVLTGLNDLQNLVQTQREEVQKRTAAMVQDAADSAAKQESRAKLLAIAATASTVLLGLAVAALVADRLVRPVHTLIGAMRDVQAGRLDFDLPVRTRDEVGALTTAFNFFIQELRSKEQIKRTFGKYVDPRILAHLLVSPDAAEAAGGRHVMSVSFADIAGFTALSERLTPTLMVKVLNRHFSLQSHAVQENQGVVDKFIGDAVMAFWGPPFTTPEEHATFACNAALAQIAAVNALRSELAELTGLRRDTPEIHLRIGLTTGEAVVGSIGSENTRSYTVIGDTVNLASRLESANRVYGTSILVGESTVRETGEKFETREIDTITAHGKCEHVHIYELLGHAGKTAPELLKLRDTFAMGLQAYRNGEWMAAEEAFGACLQIIPGDKPSQVFLDRISLLRSRPADDKWDGIWKFQAK
jgi:adenylate cyclase